MSRRHEPFLPGFADMAARRRELAEQLVQKRRAVGLSQTEVAARMGTSQSAVARLESGELDVRLSTIERYAAAVEAELLVRVQERPPPMRAGVDDARPAESGNRGLDGAEGREPGTERPGGQRKR